MKIYQSKSHVLLIVYLIIVLALGSVSTAFAKPFEYGFNASSIKDRVISKREEGLEMRGMLPRIEGLSDASFQNMLNINIDAMANQKINAAKEIKAKSITFSYISKFDINVCSILIYSTTVSASPREEVFSVNFDFVQNRQVTYGDYLGINGLKISNLVIAERIRKNLDIYNSNFPGLAENQAFYVENGKIVFNFNEQQVAPASQGIVKFEIYISNFTNLIIGKNNYLTKEQVYSIKMVPLRLICESLGFQLATDPLNRNIIDVKKNNMLITTLSLTGEAQKATNDRSLNRFIEALPENINGVTFVPISFFDTLPFVAYSVDFNGDIVFSVYN